ncbi:Putative pectinesterase 68 [Glycine soja]|uniref:Pectinesterase n=1 Tax=Glycine soja TaxID=3848 RepID=A0A0B2SIB3_GLYSO|nr:Putative pectinesterase 68 [Glycine soja]
MVQNTAPAPMPGMEGWQAVAFRISGCGFYGAQDTLCNDAGRHYYFKECYIEGSIDFIFGNGRTVFFGVYKYRGPGAAAIRGVPLAQELDLESAHPFLVQEFCQWKTLDCTF